MISLDEIAEIHSYLAADTKKLLVDGIRLVVSTRKPLEKLRVVKN